MAAMQTVAIAGAGPVGLLMALTLARRGVPVVLLEQADALPDDRRAGGFHAPSVDMFEDIGILDDLLAIGFRCPAVRMLDPMTGLDVRLDMGVLAGDVRNAYMLNCTQPQLSKTILRHLTRLSNVDIRFGHRVTGVAQDADGATIRTETAAGTSHLRTDWLVGCDGAHSIVRKAAGIGFPGYALPERFFIVETPRPFNDVLDDYCLMIDGTDWRLIIKLNEEDGSGHLWRFVRGMAPEIPTTMPGDASFPKAYMEETVRKCAAFDTIDFVNWYSYAVHQRVAETFHKGRVLLAGDAAHINNPLGGQGLNAGIHDVFNLAPKLAGVILQDYDPETLALYGRQRRTTNIDYIQATSIENRETMQEVDPEKRLALTERFRRLETDDALRRDYMMRFAMAEGLAFSQRID